MNDVSATALKFFSLARKSRNAALNCKYESDQRNIEPTVLSIVGQAATAATLRPCNAHCFVAEAGCARASLCLRVLCCANNF